MTNTESTPSLFYIIWNLKIYMRDAEETGKIYKNRKIVQPKNKSNCPEVFCKKGVKKFSKKSHENTYAGASFLIKL